MCQKHHDTCWSRIPCCFEQRRRVCDRLRQLSDVHVRTAADGWRGRHLGWGGTIRPRILRMTFEFDDQPAAGRVFEPVQLLFRVARRLRVIVLNEKLILASTSGVLSVTSSAELLLAMVEPWYEVEQPPHVALVDPARGRDSEPTLSVCVVRVGHHVTRTDSRPGSCGARSSRAHAHVLMIRSRWFGFRKNRLVAWVATLESFGRVADSVVLDVCKPFAFLGVPVFDDGDVVDVPELCELVPQIGFGHCARDHHKQTEESFLFVDVSSWTLNI